VNRKRYFSGKIFLSGVDLNKLRWYSYPAFMILRTIIIAETKKGFLK